MPNPYDGVPVDRSMVNMDKGHPVNIALLILGILLGLVAIASAGAKLRQVPNVMESMAHVGVSKSLIPVLALLEILGALGLLIGIWVPVLGLLAALGLTLYFLGAVLAHIRAKDSVKEFAAPLILFILSLIVLALELKR